MECIEIMITRALTFFILVLLRTTRSEEIGNPSSAPQLTDGEFADGRSRDVDGYVLKPDMTYDTRELLFYETVFKHNSPVKEFILEYGGYKVLEANGIRVPFMRFKNLTKNFAYPCVMKINMGLQVLQPAPELSWETIRDQFSFSISTYDCYDCEDIERGDVETGTNILRAEDVILALYKFVNKKLGFAGLVRKILRELWSIKLWFEVQEEYRFEDSSIIIVYDAADLVTGRKDLRVHVKMFDFPNVTPSNTKDRKYLQALDELIQAIDNLDSFYG